MAAPPFTQVYGAPPGGLMGGGGGGTQHGTEQSTALSREQQVEAERRAKEDAQRVAVVRVAQTNLAEALRQMNVFFQTQVTDAALQGSFLALRWVVDKIHAAKLKRDDLGLQNGTDSSSNNSSIAAPSSPSATAAAPLARNASSSFATATPTTEGANSTAMTITAFSDDVIVKRVIEEYVKAGTRKRLRTNQPIQNFIEVDTIELSRVVKTPEERSWERLCGHYRLERDTILRQSVAFFKQLSATIITQIAPRAANQVDAGVARDSIVVIVSRAEEFDVQLEVMRDEQRRLDPNNPESRVTPRFFVFSQYREAVVTAQATYRNDVGFVIAIAEGVKYNVPALVPRLADRRKQKYRSLAKHFQTGNGINLFMADYAFDGDAFYQSRPFHARNDSLNHFTESEQLEEHSSVPGGRVSKRSLNPEEAPPSECQPLVAKPVPGAPPTKKGAAAAVVAQAVPQADHLNDSGGYIEQLCFGTPLLRQTFIYPPRSTCQCFPWCREAPQDRLQGKLTAVWAIRNFHRFVGAILEGATARNRLKIVSLQHNRINVRDTDALVQLLASCPNITVLDLCGASFEADGIARLQQGLRACSKLQCVDLSEITLYEELPAGACWGTCCQSFCCCCNLPPAVTLEPLPDDILADLLSALSTSKPALAEVRCAGGVEDVAMKIIVDGKRHYNVKVAPAQQKIVEQKYAIETAAGIGYPMRGCAGERCGRILTDILRFPVLVSVDFSNNKLRSEDIATMSKLMLRTGRVFMCDLADNISEHVVTIDRCCGQAKETVKEVTSPQVLNELSRIIEDNYVRSLSRQAISVISLMYGKFSGEMAMAQQRQKDAAEAAKRDREEKTRHAELLAHQRQIELNRAAASNITVMNAVGATGRGGAGGQGGDGDYPTGRVQAIE